MSQLTAAECARRGMHSIQSDLMREQEAREKAAHGMALAATLASYLTSTICDLPGLCPPTTGYAIRAGIDAFAEEYRVGADQYEALRVAAAAARARAIDLIAAKTAGEAPQPVGGR